MCNYRSIATWANVLAFTTVGVLPVQGATLFWGGGDANWFDQGVWINAQGGPVSQPQSGDGVILNTGDQIELDEVDVLIGGLRLDHPNLELTGDGFLIVTQELRLDTGTVDLGTGLGVGSSGVTSINGAVTITRGGLEVLGITEHNTSLDTVVGSGAGIINKGTYFINDEAEFYEIGGNGYYQNFGNVNLTTDLSSSDEVFMELHFQNEAGSSLRIFDGSMRFEGRTSSRTVLTQNGTMIADPGSHFEFAEGKANFDGGSITGQVDIIRGEVHLNASGVFGATPINLTGGELYVNAFNNLSGINIDGGSFLGAANAELFDNANTWSDGLMGDSGETVIDSLATFTISGSGAEIDDTRTLRNQGTLNWEGALRFRGGSLINEGDLAFSGSMSDNNALLIEQAAGNWSISNGSTATIGFNPLKISGGVIDGEGTLQAAGTVKWTDGRINTGSFETLSYSTTTLDGNNLTLESDWSSAGSVDGTDNTNLSISSGVTVTNDGTWHSGGSYTVQGMGNFLNQGTMLGTSQSIVPSYEVSVENRGVVDLQAGDLAFSQPLLNTSGMITGIGFIRGAVQQSGTGQIKPDPDNTLRMQSLTMSGPDSSLSIAANYSSGTVKSNSAILVDGLAALDGQLLFNFTASSLPMAADTSFVVCSAGSLSGTFPEIPADRARGLLFETTYNTTDNPSVTVTVREPRTYGVWAQIYLAEQTTAEQDPLADPDGDYIINLLEYAFLTDPLVYDEWPVQTLDASQGDGTLQIRLPFNNIAEDLQLSLLQGEELDAPVEFIDPAPSQQITSGRVDTLTFSAVDLALPKGFVRVKVMLLE